MSDIHLNEPILSTEQGKKILSCIQCGTCSGSCPLSARMDHGPRALFAMIRDGETQAALSSQTPWLCVSCYQCTARCPQEIPVTDLMYLLKRLSGEQIRGSRMRRMNRAFLTVMERYGRSSEAAVMALYSLRYPAAGLENIPLAFKFLKKKRIETKPQQVESPETFKKLLKKQ